MQRSHVSRCAVLVLVAALVLFVSFAFAAPRRTSAQGYEPGAGPGSPQFFAFPSVVTSATFSADGGTIDVASGAAALTLSVPAGAFARDTQVTIFAAPPTLVASLIPPGVSLVDAFAVSWPTTSTASNPLSLTIDDSALGADAMVFEINSDSTGLIPLQGALIQPGQVSLMLSSPEAIVIVQPA